MNKSRMMGATWFAVAGTIPATAAYVTFTQYKPASYVLFLFLPVFLAGIAGYFTGFAVLLEERIQTGWQAAFRGFLSALFAYLILGVIFMSVQFGLTGPKGLGAAPIVGTVFVFLVGSLVFFPSLFTWQFVLLLTTGTIAGVLLYFFRARPSRLILVASVVIIGSVLIFLWRLPNPNHLPIYPSAKDIHQGQFEPIESGNAELRTLTFDTNDSPQKVFDFYDRELSLEGWRQSRRDLSPHTVVDLSGNYVVWVKEGTEAGQFTIGLWHSTMFAFP